MTTQPGGRQQGGSGRLLLVNQHYWPDVASTGQHLTDLAEHLVGDGWSVDVLCGRGKYLAGAVEAPEYETRNGVVIRRLRTTGFGRGRHVGRLVDYASFYVRVLLSLLLGQRYDGVLFLTTPPLLGFLGAIARFVRGQRYAVWSMDLHPDAEIAAGMLASWNPLALLLEALNRIGYRQADLVIDLGTYMKRRIVDKGVSPARTATVNVWSAADDIVPTAKADNPLVDELGLRKKFVVMYSGNAGIVHDFRDVLETMRRLKDDPRIYFLFVGNGPRRAEIEAYAREHGITNFQYRDYFSRDQLRWSLSVADVHLITLRAPFAGISVPGKLYGIMAAERPALFVGPNACESADTIRSADCGAVIDPADGQAAGRIVETIRHWAQSPDEVRQLGERGRAAFLAEYEREPNCRSFAAALDAVWGQTVPVADDVPGPELVTT